MSSERSGSMTVRSAGLVDVLDRILDKGLVIAGDIKLSLANVELLTLQIRLLICSIDKAEQIGLNWWRYDKNLSSRSGDDELEHGELTARIAELERQLKQIGSSGSESGGRPRPKPAGKRVSKKTAKKRGKVKRG